MWVSLSLGSQSGVRGAERLWNEVWKAMVTKLKVFMNPDSTFKSET